MTATKENTLYLPIKQVFFDEILSGKKTKEFREIKETTYKKYLEMWHEDGDSGLVYDDEKIDHEPGNDIMIYNGGDFPYYPIEYKFLELAVGYAKDRDKMLVEVKSISYEQAVDKNGKKPRFDYANDEFIRNDESGSLTIWNIVYHLGKVIETDLKKDR